MPCSSSRSPVASMALLVQWLSQAGQIPLVEEDYSFHDLALDWMQDLLGEATILTSPEANPAVHTSQEALELVAEVPRLPGGQRRRVLGGPRFELAGEGTAGGGEVSDDLDGIDGAAYEGVTFRGSTEDDFAMGRNGSRAAATPARPLTSSSSGRRSGSSGG